MPARERQVLFPNGYVWFVFLSALDIMLTWIVLHRGGREANSLANAVLTRWGLPGFVVFKFVLVVVVIVICEIVGKRDLKSARTLLAGGIVITCLPVATAFVLLLAHR